MIAAMPRNNSNHQFFASACTMADPRPVPDCRSVCTVVMGHSSRMVGRRPSSVIRNRPNATLTIAGMIERSKVGAPITLLRRSTLVLLQQRFAHLLELLQRRLVGFREFQVELFKRADDGG